jgi:mercuric ion transport protein
VIRERLAAGGAVAAALASSVCCLGPLVAVGLGLGAFGAAVEPLRPYLLVASAVALGFGFRQVYVRQRSASCAVDGACRSDRASRTTRIVLFIAALSTLALGAAPYAAGPLVAAFSEATAASDQGAAAEASGVVTAKARLEVKGMTCVGCETTVRLAVERTPGAVSASVRYARNEALVEYDPARTNPAALAEAITRATGYEATPKETP